MAQARITQSNHHWRNVHTEAEFENAGEMNLPAPFARDRMAPATPFTSAVGGQFPTNFPNPRMDRGPPASITGFHEEQLIADNQIVLDGSSGRIIVPSSRPDQEPDPISRFYNTESPWTSQSIPGMNQWDPRWITPNQQSVTRPHPSFGGYRDPARSNPESHVTGRQHHDSGYGTHNGPRTKSVVSNGECIDPGDDNQSYIQEMEGIQLQPSTADHSFYSESTQTAPSVTNYHSWSDQAQHVNGSLACNYPDCREEPRFKNQSELRKHQQRHEKPHKCDIPGCTRKEGFTTKNDLDRHKKSLHGIVPASSNDRSFKCAGLNCSKRSKVWPRLDNFKSHCNRMHSKEDIDELIKKSEIEPDRVGSLPNNNLEKSTSVIRQYIPNEGYIQGANLLMDLSQGHHGSGSNSNIVKVPEVLLSKTPVPQQETSDTRPLNHQVDHMRSIPFIPPQPERPLNDGRQSDGMKAINVPAQPSVLRSDTPTERTANTELSETQSQPVHVKQNSTMPSFIVSQAAIQDLSKSLISDIKKELHFEKSHLDKIQELFEGRIKEFILHSQSAKPDAFSEDMPRTKRVRCRICDKTMDRPCDLKKHEKRHSRPWGCTNASCTKTFGSKNDWKRHENSQHYQLETWRCHEPLATSKIGQCAKIFFRRDPFQAHLRRDHGVRDEEYVREQCRKRRIGRNWQNGFWCGFCKSIVKLSTRGLEAWDERFNHIDDMHFKRGQSIDDWYPMDKDLPKGKLKDRDDSRRNGEGREGDGNDSDGEQDISDDSDIDDYPTSRAKRRRSSNGNDRDGNDVEEDDERQRSRTTPRPMHSKDEDWFCNDCHYGPLNALTDMHCSSCGQRRG